MMGLLTAFANNPQFQQQLAAIQQQQSPGFQGPQMTLPQAPVNLGAGGNAAGARAGPFAMQGGNPLNNYGMSIGDPLSVMMQQRFGRQQF